MVTVWEFEEYWAYISSFTLTTPPRSRENLSKQSPSGRFPPRPGRVVCWKPNCESPSCGFRVFKGGETVWAMTESYVSGDHCQGGIALV